MPVSDPISTRFAEVAARCEETLALPEMAAAAEAAAGHGLTSPAIIELATQTARTGLPQENWERLAEACRKEGTPDTGYTLPRFVLLTAGRQNLARIPSLPVAAEVKLRLLDQFLYACAPDREREQLLDPRHYGFRVMCKFMLLDRFPAGQFDWEVSGFARSTLWKAPLRDVPRILRGLFRAGGHVPFFESHTAFRRELPILTEEAERSALRLMADSMRLQPEIRGYVAFSWLLSPNLPKASPHLGWLAELCRECARFGAAWTEIGEAPPSSGYLAGDRRRRKLYESGAWKPRLGVLLWARPDLLRWREYRFGAYG